MKYFIALFVLLCFVGSAHADQAQVLCYETQPGVFTSCVPVTVTNPLPVTSH
jgi:hypothetical protein